MLLDDGVEPLIYRRLSVPTLIVKIARSNFNLLVIGRHQSWLVNIKAVHASHFIGTSQAIRMSTLANSVYSWELLKNFVLRYASAGARIEVYCLHPRDNWDHRIAYFDKKKEALVQLAGCSLPAINGFILPSFIQTPIATMNLSQSWLLGWCKIKLAIVAALKDVKPKPQAIISGCE